MPQIISSLKNVLNKEYWTTQDNRKIFPHEFEDEHLANTIGYLHRQVRRHRLEEARDLCAMVYHTGNRNADVEAYYRAYTQEVDKFLDPSITDKEWLKQNSKIYMLLMEEAKYRGVEIIDKPKRTTYKGTVTTRYNHTPNYTFNW